MKHEIRRDNLNDLLEQEFSEIVYAGVADVSPHIAWCKENIGPDATIQFQNDWVLYESDYSWTWFPSKGFWFKVARDAVAFRMVFDGTKVKNASQT